MRFANCGAGRTREQSMRCDGPDRTHLERKMFSKRATVAGDERLRFDGGSLGCKRHRNWRRKSSARGLALQSASGAPPRFVPTAQRGRGDRSPAQRGPSLARRLPRVRMRRGRSLPNQMCVACLFGSGLPGKYRRQRWLTLHQALQRRLHLIEIFEAVHASVRPRTRRGFAVRAAGARKG